MGKGGSFLEVARDVFNPDVEGAVDFGTFVTSRDYLGVTGIFPFWLKELETFGESTSRLLLTGSLGGGKSTLGNLCLLYRIYCLFLHGDPCRFLGMVEGSPVSCLYFSVSMRIAKKSGFAQLKNFIDNSKWFTNHYPRDKGIDSSIVFKNGFSIDFASGEAHAIGLNVWGYILDEANFRSGVGNGSADEYSEVTQLAQQLEDRQFVRFALGGVLQSFCCYISSASFSSSFIDTKMGELSHDPHGKIITAVAYKIAPDKYSKKRFEVFCGYGQLSPAVVQSSTHKKTLIASTKLPERAAKALFEQPPLDLLPQFKKNIYLAIQNHCGRATAMRGSFITNYGIVRDAYDKTHVSPFLQDSLILSNQDDVTISSIVDWDRFDYVDRPHSLMLDLSTTGDPGSLSCTRFDGMLPNGQKMHTHVFTIALLPPEYPAMLRISKVEDFIYEFAEQINLAAFAADQFQSAMLRQNVTAELGLPDIRLSLDASDVPHLLWLSALVDERFKMHYYEEVDLEIREAVHDVRRHKVVKRDGSHDDQFQTLVGSFYLSETVGSVAGTVDGLTDARYNLASANKLTSMIQRLGYGQSVTPSIGRVTQEVRNDGSTKYEIKTPASRIEATSRRRFKSFLSSLDSAEDDDTPLKGW